MFSFYTKEKIGCVHHTNLIFNNKFQKPKNYYHHLPMLKKTLKFSCWIHLPCQHFQHNLSLFQKIVAKTPTRYRHYYLNIDLKEGERENKSLKLLQMKCYKLGQMVRMQVLLCLWNTCFLRVTKTIIVSTKIDAKLHQYCHTHHPLTRSLADLQDHWTRKNYLQNF